LTKFFIALIAMIALRTGLEYIFLYECPWKYEDRGLNNFLKSVVNTIKAFVDTFLLFLQLMVVIGYTITREYMSEMSYKVVIGATITKFFLCELDQAFMGTFLSFFLGVCEVIFQGLLLIVIIHFMAVNIAKTGLVLRLTENHRFLSLVHKQI